MLKSIVARCKIITVTTSSSLGELLTMCCSFLHNSVMHWPQPETWMPASVYCHGTVCVTVAYSGSGRGSARLSSTAEFQFCINLTKNSNILMN